MERLVYWRDIGQEDLPEIEHPSFAVTKVRRVLEFAPCTAGLDALLRSCNIWSVSNLQPDDRQRILRRIEDAEWLLMTQSPFSPLLDDRSGQYRHILSCEPKRYLETGRVSRRPESGPGKWRTQKIEKNWLRNSVAFAANRITSLGDEGRMWLSEGKDYANTTRVVTQRWVPLDEHDKYVALRSVSRRYEESRQISQIYVEADDNWQVSGKSWHWVPVLANEVYEYKKGL